MTTNELTAALDQMTDAQLEAYAAQLARTLPSDATIQRVQQHIARRNANAAQLKSMFNIEDTSILGSK